LNKVYCPRRKANAQLRMCIADKNGTKIKLRLEFLEGRLYLPIIHIERI
jgi:hypothetical protein